MNEVQYGILHCHTENSLRDSVMSVKALVKRAKELGAPAVALTDHGSMTGYIDFIDICKEEGIKPIVGVEAYIEENNEGRRHLILMAKDYQGFQSLIKAVTESNTRVAKVKTQAFPRMNRDILMKHFGPDSPGHGHVIATSACISGILGSLIQCNSKMEADLEEYQLKQKALESPASESYKQNSEVLKTLKDQQKELTKAAADCRKAAARSLLSLEKKMLCAPEGSEKKAYATEAYGSAKAARDMAEQRLSELSDQRNQVEGEIKRLSPIIAQMKNQVKKWEKIQSDIDRIQKNHIPDDKIDTALTSEALWYQNLFGMEGFYIELQNHGLPEEKKIMPRLALLSDKTGIPVCLANDAHIPEKTGDAVLARGIIRANTFNNWLPPKAADREMYVKTDRELLTAVEAIVPNKKVMEGYENIGKIVQACNLTFPQGNHYPKFVTPDGTAVEEYLEKLVEQRISERFKPEEFGPEYKARKEYELPTIIRMGYADYHCIVEDCVRYARAAGKLDLEDPAEQKIALSFDTEVIENLVRNRVGECVGPGRGSGAGSLICYILGITNIDPIKYGLLFERFLNPERISMPDIDVDIESNVRPYVVEYAKYKYGTDAVCGIMNRGTQAGKAALKTAGRVYGLEKTNDSAAFLSLADEISKKAVELSGDELNLNLAELKEELNQLYTRNRHALEIIRYARLIEGSVTQVGQHAGGIIITDGAPVDDYVPLIYNSTNHIMTTQCDMIQAEKIGLLKIDFLGLVRLTIITETLREIYNSTGTFIDMDQIPFEAEVFQKIYAAAMTNAIFQFESIGMKKMLRSFKPETIYDLILLVAMYRPGPMQYLPNVIAVKSGKKKVQYLIPELEPILKDTYGSIIYQEQVQEIFRRLAGYSLGQADLVRRAMSKKKDDMLAAEREAFLYGDPSRGIKGCVANGIDEARAKQLFSEMADFSKYAFNKSHAACYAVLSYQTGWLKYHYPKEYIKSVLNNTEFEKIPGLADDLRIMAIDLNTPDINSSKQNFSIHNGGIQFGLGSIKGLKSSVISIITEREKHGPFLSVQDFVYRVRPSRKTMDCLTEAGAFDRLCTNRTAISEEVRFFMKKLDQIGKYEEELLEAYDQKKSRGYQEKLKKAKQEIYDVTFNEDICEDMLQKLKKEKELINAFASGSPLDLYPSPSKCGAAAIRDLLYHSKRDVMMIGLISDFKVMHRKTDKAEMAFFTLSDKTGDVHVCCFTKQYAKFKDYLSDDTVVKISGSIMENQEDDDILKISVESVSPVSPLKNTIIIYIRDIEEWAIATERALKPYVAKNGNPSVVYDLTMDEFRKCEFLLSPTVLQDKKIHSSIQNLRG